MQGEWDDWDDDEDDVEGDEYRAPLVASFDEINDLIPPKSKSPSKSHVDVLKQITVNIRKLRKYRVTLMASTHRFNQLDLDVRSQFSYYFIKKSYGQDIYQFMNTNLWTVNAQGYQAAMRFVTSMPQDQVLVFDSDGSYDKMRWPDIPRVKPRHRIRGEVRDADDGKQKKYDDIDFIIMALRSRSPPMGFTDIAGVVGIDRSNVSRRAKKLSKAHAVLLQHMREDVS
jgi:hypothetical protein